jgi:toxin ParE1/3/4
MPSGWRANGVTHRVVFRAAAEDDLLALYRYVADSSDLARAGSYMERIEQACMNLAAFPERGTRRDDIVPGLRTIGFERRVTIAFRVLDHVVEILAIAYAGRQFEGGLRQD